MTDRFKKKKVKVRLRQINFLKTVLFSKQKAKIRIVTKLNHFMLQGASLRGELVNSVNEYWLGSAGI